MKKKVVKVIATVSIIVLTLVITVVPCLAAPSGIGRLQGGRQPFYVDIINMPRYWSWSNNSWTLAAPSIGIYGEFSEYGANTFADGFVIGGEFTGMTTIESYDGEVEIASNYVTYRIPNDIFNVPYYEVSFDGFEVLGNATCRVVGEIVSANGSEHRPFDTSWTCSIDNGWYTTRDILTRIPVEFSSGDYISYTSMIGFDVTLNNPDAYIASINTQWSIPDVGFVINPFVDNIIENVDVLSWLPNTIDSFFNVSVFGDVTIGNIFLLVLAIPALIAVLRMLGGVG